MSTKLIEGMIDSLNCSHLCFFAVLRSAVDEHFGEKEQLLTEAAALFDEARRKRKRRSSKSPLTAMQKRMSVRLLRR